MAIRAQLEEWQLDESGPEAYERYMVPRMFAPWAEQLVELAEVRAGGRVLDVATGTGIVARTAAARMGRGRVVGLDRNPAMLEEARRAALDLRPEVEWRLGDAAALPFPDRAFDVVFCQQAMQFFPDRLVALREMGRVLDGGGRVAVAVWRAIEHHPAYLVLASALGRHAGTDAETVMRSPFARWSREELRGLLASAGFSGVRVLLGIGSMRFPSVEEFLRREAASSPLAESLAALAPTAREALLGDLRDGLRAYTDDGGVVFPMETYLAVGVRPGA